MAVLAESNVASRIPAQDLRRARSFYADKLGLEPSRSGLEGFVTGAVMASSRSSNPLGPLMEITRRWRERSTTSRRQSRSFASAA